MAARRKAKAASGTGSARDHIQGSCIVLHGPPKIGKTTLCSKFPTPHCWLATERGHRYINEDSQAGVHALTAGHEGWSDFLSVVVSDKPKAKTYIVDTVSGLYSMCLEYVCDKNNWNHPSDGAHGKGWNSLRREFQNGLSHLVDLSSKHNATLILIDHTKTDTIETTTGNFEKVTTMMPGQARSIVMPVPDHIWFLGYDDDDPKDALVSETAKRCLFVRGSNEVEAGSRDPNVTINYIKPLSRTNPYLQINKKLHG